MKVPTPFEPEPEKRSAVRLEQSFTVASLLELIRSAQSSTSPNTHEQFADWRWRFYWECQEGALADVNDEQLDRAAGAALDVDAQWDLFLVNMYSSDELQELDLATVRLPDEWWRDWETDLVRASSGEGRS